MTILIDPPTNEIKSGNNNLEEKFLVPNEKQLLEFGKFCRVFFRSGLSTTSDNCTSTAIESRDKSEEAKAVLSALDALVAGEAIEDHVVKLPKYETAIDSCGLMACLKLNSISGDTLSSYIDIRDKERKDAHRDKMVERQVNFKKTIVKILEEKDKISAEENNNVMRMELVRFAQRTTRKFVNSYRNKIGSHSLLAGIVKFLTNQIDESCHLRWTIHGFTITESCISPGEKYICDCLDLLSSLFEVSIDEESSSANETILILQIKVGYSNYSLKRILRELPALGELDARPTGNILETELKRNNITGENDEYESLFDWCLSNCIIS